MQVKRTLDQALLDAAIAGDAERVETLIGQGADAGAANRYDVTALSFAADRGHVDVVRVLLEAGAEAVWNMYSETGSALASEVIDYYQEKNRA